MDAIEENDNYASSVAFTESLIDQVKSSDIADMVQLQRDM